MEFQSYAYGKNHFELDRDLQALLRSYWAGYPDRRGTLVEFGRLAGGTALEVAYHVDHDAIPALAMFDLDGRRVDRVRLSPAHASLLKSIAPINGAPYSGGSWHEHYAQGYLLADPGLYCLATISNNTLYIVAKYAPEHGHWKEPLLAGEAWGATWMTEVQGGSDLGANATRAVQAGGVWRLTGEKYFASGAGLADLALVTARPEGAPNGAKGLALFLMPRLDRDGRLNFTVRRLKDKSATRAVPSGEVEFRASEAWLVGQAELGVYYSLETLLVSRLANAAAAMGIARKAHLEAILRSARRSAFGRLLREQPLARRDLVDMAVRQAGGLALTFHAVDWFDCAWHERPPYSDVYHYARFLAHLAKNRTADHAAALTQAAMELFGGVGFLEEYALARWHREALITPIWEGTSNIQALDMLECLTKKRSFEPFVEEFFPLLESVDTEEARIARDSIETTLYGLLRQPAEAQQWHAKHALARLADAAQVGLLYRLSRSAGPRYASLAALYARRFLKGEDYPAWAMEDEGLGQDLAG